MLNTKQIKHLQQKYSLTYQINYAFHCNDVIGFEDKDILEVGGSLPDEFVFENLKAKTWTVVNSEDNYTNDYDALKAKAILNKDNIIIQKGFGTPHANRYSYFLTKIENLPAQHFEKYDIIFTIATLEHMQKFPIALDRMYRALKPNGKLFAIFSPVWSAYNGHHIPSMVDKNGVEISMNNEFIPPWGHLVMGPSSMYSHLLTKTDKDTAAELTYQIYNTPSINRFFSEDYLNFIEESDFTIEKFDTLFNQMVPPYTQKKLEQLHPGKKSFGNNGILIILNK